MATPSPPAAASDPAPVELQPFLETLWDRSATLRGAPVLSISVHAYDGKSVTVRLPQPREAAEVFRRTAHTAMGQKMLQALAGAEEPMSVKEWAAATGYEYSGTFRETAKALAEVGEAVKDPDGRYRLPGE